VSRGDGFGRWSRASGGQVGAETREVDGGIAV
jgi:hypothetical protein